MEGLNEGTGECALMPGEPRRQPTDAEVVGDHIARLAELARAHGARIIVWGDYTLYVRCDEIRLSVVQRLVVTNDPDWTPSG